MQVRVLAVPYDSGRPDLRAGLGPQALLDGGLTDAITRAGHTVAVDTLRVDDRPLVPEPFVAQSLWRAVADRVRAARTDGAFPVVLTGACHVAVGVTAGLGASGLGVCWFDAHADCNTPDTTVTGFFDGMAVTAMMGRCWRNLTNAVPGFLPVPADRIILAGVRDVDPAERAMIAALGVTEVSVGAGHALAGALDAPLRDAEAVYLHVDLDVLDPSEGTVNHLSGSPGLSLDQLLADIGAIAAVRPLQALTLSAYAPEYDTERRIPRAAAAVLRAALVGAEVPAAG